MIREVNCNCNGKNIYGLLYSPDEIEYKLPAVILCHGLYANHSWLTYYAEELVKENIISYVFDFCGCMESKSDGDFISSSVLTEKENLSSVIDMVSHLDIVDKRQIYLLGHSQGGLVAAMSSIDDNISGLFLLSPAFNVPHEMGMTIPPEEGS